jgi:tetratricopeptide (TPR) repeat protein
MRQQSRPVRECLPALERAAALATDATDRESYLIGAMLHNVTGNLPAATAALEALLRLYPADFTAMDLLVEVYFRAGRLNKAVDLAVLRAEHTPGDFAANARAAQALTIATQETERPRLFAARALNLATPAAIRDWPGLYAWLHGLPIFQRWLAGETREALEALRALEQTLSTRVSGERDAFAGVIGFAYLAFGMPQDAERIFRHAASPERQLDLAALALSRGDEARARQWLRQVPQLASARPALFARAGLIEEAERGLESAPPSESWEGRAFAARGLIDGRRGRRESAMTALRRSLDLLRWSGEPEYFLAIEELVRITRARGDDERALAFLTAAAAERAHTYGRTQWTAAQWAALSTTLAALHEQRGQHDAAERVNGSLRQVLQLREPVAASRVR